MLCGDGVQCAGCVGAHLRGLYRKVVVMQEGHNTISWRPSEMRNPRLVVDVQDQLSTKAVSETLRARAYGRCQQLTYKLHAHLGLRSSAFLQGACLLLLLQPATPATTANRRGAHPEPTSPEPERGRPAWRCLGEKDKCPSIFGHNGLLRPWISCFVLFWPKP